MSGANGKCVVWMAKHDATRDCVYVGRSDMSIMAFLRPHRKGLLLEIVRRGLRRNQLRRDTVKPYERYIIPGEYDLESVVAFVHMKTGDNCDAPAIAKRKKALEAKATQIERRTLRRREWADGAWTWAPVALERVNKKIAVSVKIMQSRRRGEIRQTLRDTGIWERRGRLGWVVDGAFWKWLPLATFVQGSSRSMRSWWTHYATRLRVNDIRATEAAGLGDPGPRPKPKRVSIAVLEARRTANVERWRAAERAVKSEIVEGRLPESLSSIRGWKDVPFSDLVVLAQHGLVRSKAWPLYLSQVRAPFSSVLSAHTSWLNRGDAQHFELYVRYLAGLPKTTRVRDLLMTLLNAGVPETTLVQLGCRTAAELQKLQEIARVIIPALQSTGPRLTCLYEPPEIDLPAGWEWATHETFPTLSDYYRCCISNEPYYVGEIVAGRAHVFFRRDRKTNGGALAFVQWDKTWRVFEIEGFAHTECSLSFLQEARDVAIAINRRMPGQHKPVAQLPAKRLRATDVVRTGDLQAMRMAQALLAAWEPDAVQQPMNEAV